MTVFRKKSKQADIDIPYNNIRALLDRNHDCISNMACFIGYSTSHISMVVNRKAMPSLYLAYRISDYLAKPIEEVFFLRG